MDEWVKRACQQQADNKALVSFSYIDAKYNIRASSCESICNGMAGAEIR